MCWSMYSNQKDGHTFTHPCALDILIKNPEMHTGKKKDKVSSTNGAGQTGCLHVEECK